MKVVVNIALSVLGVVILMTGCAQKVNIKALAPAEVSEMATKKKVAVTVFKGDKVFIDGEAGYVSSIKNTTTEPAYNGINIVYHIYYRQPNGMKTFRPSDNLIGVVSIDEITKVNDDNIKLFHSKSLERALQVEKDALDKFDLKETENNKEMIYLMATYHITISKDSIAVITPLFDKFKKDFTLPKAEREVISESYFRDKRVIYNGYIRDYINSKKVYFLI